MSAAKSDDKKVLVRNRKAQHDYVLEGTLEAGIALVGSEVKSLRDAQASLVDAFAQLRGGEVWLVGAQVNTWPFSNQFNHEPRRDRKLLLHKHEIRKLAVKVNDKGYTLVPTEIYLKQGKIKVTLALAKGKRQYEKRQDKKAQEARREMEEATGRSRKG